MNNTRINFILKTKLTPAEKLMLIGIYTNPVTTIKYLSSLTGITSVTCTNGCKKLQDNNYITKQESGLYFVNFNTILASEPLEEPIPLDIMIPVADMEDTEVTVSSVTTCKEGESF